MNFLNPKSFAEHMHPENNYLEDLKNQGLIEAEEIKEEEFTEPTLIVVEKESLGRRSGAGNIPDFLKSTIATVALTSGETQESIGQAFGVRQEMVSRFKDGKTSSNDVNPELKALTDEIKEGKKASRETIENEALLKTLSTLKILTEDDIECLGAKDKADVAVKLSKVAANMRDKVVTNDNRMMLIIKAPPVREHLNNYDVVEVG